MPLPGQVVHSSGQRDGDGRLGIQGGCRIGQLTAESPFGTPQPLRYCTTADARLEVRSLLGSDRLQVRFEQVLAHRLAVHRALAG